MAKHFRDVDIEFPCPNCSHKLKRTAGRIEQDPLVTCPKCHNSVKLEASQFRQEMTKVDRAMDDLYRRIERFGK
jgi:hypothetical protein